MAIVVHVREKKTRFREVLHEESMGRARSVVKGSVMGVRRVVMNDMFGLF